jgi:hypothetical protein
MAHIRRALIAGLAAVPLAATVSAAVPIILPALEIDLVDEAINLRASEIERAMSDPELQSLVVYAWRNRWVGFSSGVCMVWCARDGAGMTRPLTCRCRP